MKNLLRKTLITLLALAILFLSCLANVSIAGYGYDVEIIEYDTIDEYMKGFYGEGYNYKSSDGITLQWANIKDYSGLSELSNLETLNLYQMEGENIKLPELPNLKELEITYTNFRSLDLTNLTGLEKLTIHGVNIELATIELKNMTKLKELNIDWQIANLNIKLVNTNNINHLEIDTYNVNIETENSNFNNLEEIKILGSNYGNWNMFGQARSVEIQAADLSQEDIDIFSNAEIIDLYSCFWDGTLTIKNPKLEELITQEIFSKIDITKATNLKKFAYFVYVGPQDGVIIDNSSYIISNMDDVIEVSEVGRYVYIGRKSETLKTVTLEQYITQNYPNQNKENITELEIKNINIKDFRNLKKLPNLEKLTLKNMNLTSIDFKDLENLEELYIKNSTLDGVLYLSNNKNLNHLEVYLRGDLSNSIIYLNELEVDYVDFTFNRYESSNFNILKTLKSNLDFDLYSNYDEETGDTSYIHKLVYGGYGIGDEIYGFLEDPMADTAYLNGISFLCGFTLNEGKISVGNVKNVFNDEVQINVYDANNKLITDNNVTAYTGMKVEVIKKGDEYYEDYLVWSDGEVIGTTEVVIYGDVNGDGKITSTDALQIIKNKNQKLFIENEANYLAGQVTKDSRNLNKEPSAIDALAIIKHLNGRYEIKQNIWY